MIDKDSEFQLCQRTLQKGARLKLLIIKRKWSWTFLLILCIGLLDVILLSRAYWTNSVPVGWDTPVYISMAKRTASQGVLWLFSESHYTHFYSILSSIILRSGLLDAFAIEVILPLILSFFVVVLMSFVMLKWFNDSKLAFFGAFFTIGWYSLFSLTASLHRNLMAVVFLLIILAYMPEYFKHRTIFLTTLFSVLAFLMILTQWETYIISAAILIVYAFVLKIFIRKTKVKDILLNMFIYLSPLLVVTIILSQFLSEFVTLYFTSLLPIKSLMSIVEIPLYLGAHLLPLVVLGFVWSVKELKNQGQHREELALLVSWSISIIAGTLAVPFSGMNIPQWRIMVFFPVPIFAAVGLNHAIKSVRKKKIRSPHNYRKSTSVVLAVSLIMVNIWVATLYADVWMQPYISKNTYQSLRWIEQKHDFSQEPIIVFYFAAGEYTQGILDLYRNWINTAVNNHYAFFGKLHYLLGEYAMPFHDTYMNDVSLATWTELESISSHWYDHPVLVIQGDFYPSLSPNEKGLLDEIAPGVFVLREDFQSLPGLHNIRLAAYRDSFSSSQNWYAAKKNWSIEENVAEHVEDSPKSQFNMTFSLPINEAGNYTINIRMQDNEVSSAPVKVFIDNVITSTVYYSGTMQPKVFTLQVRNLTRNFHYVTLSIDDLSKPHNISFDYIECLLERT